MTWIVAANAFNGATCIADIQATFPFQDKNRPPLYFNCVRKLHKIWKNAYVAFSGDIRTGLLLIKDLKGACATWYARDSRINFSLEGDDLPNFQEWLRQTYRHHNGSKSPELELMVLWSYQEGEDVHWNTGVRRFIWPDFRFNGTGPLQVDQCGSGLRSNELQVLSEFLKGRGEIHDTLYQSIFGDTVPSNLYTAKKIRNLLVREAGRASFPGVSSIFTSVLMETPVSDHWDEETDFPMFVQILKRLGVQAADQQTRGDMLRAFAIDIPTIDARVKQLRGAYPQQFLELSTAFTELAWKVVNRDWGAPHRIEEQFHTGENPPNGAQLCETWDQVRRFMVAKGLKPHAMSAIA